MRPSKRANKVKICCIDIDDEYDAALHSKVEPNLSAEGGENMDSSHHQWVTSSIKNPSCSKAETSSLDFEKNLFKQKSENVSIFSHKKSSNKEQSIEPKNQCGLKDGYPSESQTVLLRAKSQILKLFKPNPFSKVKCCSVFNKHSQPHSKALTEDYILKSNLKSLFADAASTSVDHKECEQETKDSSKLQFVLSEANNSPCFNTDSSIIPHNNQRKSGIENPSKQIFALSKAKNFLSSEADTGLFDHKVSESRNKSLSKQQYVRLVPKNPSCRNSETSCVTVNKQENENSSNAVIKKQLLDTDKSQSLNFDFNQKEIKKCIDYLNTKYLVPHTMVGTDISTAPCIPNDNLSNTTSHNTCQPGCSDVVILPSTVDLEKSNSSDCFLFLEQKKRKSREQNDNLRFPSKRLKQGGPRCSAARIKVVKSIEDIFKTSTSSNTSYFDFQNKANTSKFPISLSFAEEYQQRKGDTRDFQPLKNVIHNSTAETQHDYLNKQLISAISEIQNNSKLSNSALGDSSKYSTNFASQSNSAIKPRIINAQESGREVEYIQDQDISFHVIKWNVAWLSLQNNEYPSICGETEIKPVKNTYTSITDYFKTYYGLLLLSIWLNTYTLWKKRPYMHNWQLTSSASETHYYKNTCQSIVIPLGAPFEKSIILVTCSRPDGRTQRLFGYVYGVEIRHRIPPSSQNRYRFMLDVVLSFYTAEKLYTYINDTITIQKLWQLEVATAQCAALCHAEFSSFTNILLNPKNNAQKIRVIHLPLDYWKNLKLHIDKIICSAMSVDNSFTLVQRLKGTETCLIILMLVRFCLDHGSTILVCLMDRIKFLDIANRLKYVKNTILAVQKRVFIPKDLERKTLLSCASRLYNKTPDNAELEVLKDSKIILTMMPDLYLGSGKASVLEPNLTCVIDDAHLCTEAETALPLSYNPKNVVMLGDPTKYAPTHPVLRRLNYHTSLFHRLFEYAH